MERVGRRTARCPGAVVKPVVEELGGSVAGKRSTSLAETDQFLEVVERDVVAPRSVHSTEATGVGSGPVQLQSVEDSVDERGVEFPLHVLTVRLHARHAWLSDPR